MGLFSKRDADTPDERATALHSEAAKEFKRGDKAFRHGDEASASKSYRKAVGYQMRAANERS